MTSYNLYPGTPQLAAANDTNGSNLGTEFYVTAPAWLTQLRFLQPATGVETSTRTAGLYTVDGVMVAGPFSIPAPLPGAWGAVTLPTAYPLAANTRYRAVIFHPHGLYAASGAYFAGADQISGPLVVPGSANATANAQGSYDYGGALGFPISTYNSAAYYSDATISDTDPAAPPPPPPPSGAVDVTVTGTLDPRRWAVTLLPGTKTATLEPRRWDGSL